MILGALVGAFSGCFEWCFTHDIYSARERESISLCFGHDLVLKRVFPCTLGTFSIKECLLVLWCDSYNTAERVFPCALGTFSVKEKVCFLVL
jgi:hypothetical protein